jgi:23S rRNA pseudouridine1911/1915/1917 synthase
LSETSSQVQFNNDESERLDKYLVSCFPDYSRSQLQRLIGEGYILVNGIQPTKTGLIVEKGDLIDIRFPEPEPIDIIPENIPLEILYEDKNLLVINKPAGMVVHPSAGHSKGTLVHAVMGHVPFLQGIGGKMRPGIVHRLDKDTSGLILIAKNDNSHRWLQRQFKLRDVDKIYIALVDGCPATPTGRIIAPIYRDRAQRKKMVIAPEGKGRPSVTEYQTIKQFVDHTLLKVHPLTGRTHQIRVHLASLRIPIAGDSVYGHKKQSIGIGRHFLHASELSIRLPGEKNKTTFHAELPDELKNVLESLK